MISPKTPSEIFWCWVDISDVCIVCFLYGVLMLHSPGSGLEHV